MKKYSVEYHDLDGLGARRTRVFQMPAVQGDYWAAVTDVLCPVCEGGDIRWAEAGYVPGYRICAGCTRHFMAMGTINLPTLVRVNNRRG